MPSMLSKRVPLWGGHAYGNSFLVILISASNLSSFLYLVNFSNTVTSLRRSWAWVLASVFESSSGILSKEFSRGDELIASKSSEC